jgi:Ran GTPase-activating protein (RanGAP) involved in mRNA processing and transport
LNLWCKVRVLRPKDCRLERKGAERLAKAIARFLSAYLVGLFLEGNRTQEGGGRSLANTLRLNITLASLNLRFNGPGEGGMRELAETLRLNITLKSLNLRENGLGEGGGRALAEALRLNTTLKSLNFGCNILGEGGGRALADALRVNTTLSSLILHYNRVGEAGGRALAEALRLNTTVTSLNLGCDILGEGGGRALTDALRLNTTLASLYLNWNDLRIEVDRRECPPGGLFLSDWGAEEEMHPRLNEAIKKLLVQIGVRLFLEHAVAESLCTNCHQKHGNQHALSAPSLKEMGPQEGISYVQIS